MLQSAEYFMAGFFGLAWSSNVTLEVTIEAPDYNNTLDGYYRCPNANSGVSMGGYNGNVRPITQRSLVAITECLQLRTCGSLSTSRMLRNVCKEWCLEILNGYLKIHVRRRTIYLFRILHAMLIYLDNAQKLCAYETVALGYSQWCGLFTLEEWQGFEYSLDITFAGGFGFQSPTGRAIGIGAFNL
jgi:hypothetical protein